MKEVDIVKAIMKYLKTVPGCFCWKEHGGMYGTAGIPDIIACIKCKDNDKLEEFIREVDKILVAMVLLQPLI